MDNPKNEIAQKLKEANNVLVTVSANPTVDQLAAAIALTLLLNKLDKHASAVFSGQVPSTIEFLRPEDTIEKNTDSLRDFIIALDKSKADKLRYKVEDKMVKIFITPYRTSITDQDLIFSQGDFNVDVVVGIGVKVREDLDQAIVSHGGILHDATVVSINTSEAGSIGSINWVDVQASSLCEMIVGEAELLKAGLIDGQIATALLTGIVAETERFSNVKTTSNTMNASAKLMASGANQQLVATQLDVTETKPVPEQPREEEETPPNDPPAASLPEESSATETAENGTLQVEHKEELPEPQPPEEELPDAPEDIPKKEVPDTQDDQAADRHFMSQPPTMAKEIGKNEAPDQETTEADADLPVELEKITTESEDKTPVPSNDALSPDDTEPEAPVDTADNEKAPEAKNAAEPAPKTDMPAAADEAPEPKAIDPMQFIETPRQTLDTIEHIVGSPHVNAEPQASESEEVSEAPEVTESAQSAPSSDLDQAREAVQAAMEQTPNAASVPSPVVAPIAEVPEDAEQDLPAIEIDPDTGNIAPPPTVISPTVQAEQPVETDAPKPLMPPPFALPTNPITTSDSNVSGPPPPPVPPPMMPPMNGAATAFPSTPNPFTLPPTQ